MGGIFVLFGEEVREVQGALNVSDGNIFELDLFANSVFANLDVAEAFGGHAVGPGDAGGVVVVDDGGPGHVFGVEIEIAEDIVKILEKFDAFVGGIDFCFGGAAGGDGLATRGPVDRAVDP